MSRRLVFLVPASFGLLVGCRQADGAVFLSATRLTVGGLSIDALDVRARDLSAVEDLEVFRGQQGVPNLEVDKCRAFVDGAGQVETPGDRTDGGVITLSGASAIGRDVAFIFDPDNDPYTDNANGENPIFTPGDELSFSGTGNGNIKDFDEKVNFPQDVVLIGDPFTFIRGQDAVVTWNEANDAADSVSVIFTQGNSQIFCTNVKDNGSFAIPGELTALLNAGGGNIVVSRVNGLDLLSDPDEVVDKLEKGKELFVQALSIVIGQANLQDP
jgi:hypothetical protein